MNKSEAEQHSGKLNLRQIKDTLLHKLPPRILARIALTIMVLGGLGTIAADCGGGGGGGDNMNMSTLQAEDKKNNPSLATEIKIREILDDHTPSFVGTQTP